MGAFQYVTQGIINAFNAAGHQASRWDGSQQQWDLFKPDLYLGCSGHRQNIPTNRGHTKIGIHVNPYSDNKIGSVDGGPTIDESQSAIDWTVNQKPDFVFGYVSNTYIPTYFGHWTSRHGIKVLEMMCAADTTIYKPHAHSKQFECDIAWVGGYWGYKAKMLDIYLKPLFDKYKTKLFGWGGWANNQTISDKDVPILFSSAKVCPSVSEPHSRDFPIDIPERVFKVPASGGFTIHTPSPAISDLFGSSIPMATNEKEWFDLIEYYIKNDDIRVRASTKQRRVILARHTYFDRCINVLNSIGYEQEAQKMQSFKLLS